MCRVTRKPSRQVTLIPFGPYPFVFFLSSSFSCYRSLHAFLLELQLFAVLFFCRMPELNTVPTTLQKKPIPPFISSSLFFFFSEGSLALVEALLSFQHFVFVLGVGSFLFFSFFPSSFLFLWRYLLFGKSM